MTLPRRYPATEVTPERKVLQHLLRERLALVDDKGFLGLPFPQDGIARANVAYRLLTEGWRQTVRFGWSVQQSLWARGKFRSE